LTLSVIIVSYQVRCFLEQCLCSVQQAINGLDAEVIVVDNHSHDGSRLFLEQAFPWVRFVWNTENTGFAKANNQALAMATGDFILFLNPDMILPENFFHQSIPFMRNDPGIGAMGFKMIDGAGFFLPESKRMEPTAWRACCRFLRLSALFSRSSAFAGYYAGHIADTDEADVEVLAGACMMLSAAAAKATGGFDERYFMYAEDIDLSLMVRKAGFRNRYFPHTPVIHFKGESTRKLTLTYIRHFYGAMDLYVRKFYREQPVVRLLMQSSIALGRFVSYAKICVQKTMHLLISLFPVKQKPVNMLVLASNASLNDLVRIVPYAPRPICISGRVYADPADQSYAVGGFHELDQLAQRTGSDMILFCIGDIQAGRMIEWMEKRPGKYEYLMHYRGSRSLVGSSHKDKKGWQVSPV